MTMPSTWRHSEAPDIKGHPPSSLVGPSSQRLVNKSFESLDLFLCGFVDFPKSGEDCSLRLPHHCVRCEIRGAYITGETIDEFGSGHMTCRVIWYFVLLVAIIGVLANSLIILILRQRKTDHSFDFLISLLAYVDLFCCLTTFSSATAPLAYFENWHGRGKGAMLWIYASSLTLLLCRSISIFVTLLITIERYLAIAFPLRSITWFTKNKTRLQTVLAIFFSILISIPRYSSLYIGPNIYGSQPGGLDIPSLRHLSHIYLPTRLYDFWQLSFHGAHNQVEYWIPIPLLLLFNYLSYTKVKKLCKKRQQMNCSQRQELQAARMFLPVVVLLLCCNLWPTIAFVIMQVWGIFHREMWMIWSLTIALNSSANFAIYYYRGQGFRCEARLFLSQILSRPRFALSPRSRKRHLINPRHQPGKPDPHRSGGSGLSGITVTNMSTASTNISLPLCLAHDNVKIVSASATTRQDYYAKYLPYKF